MTTTFRCRQAKAPGPCDLLASNLGPVVVQGSSGRVARRHTKLMLAYGTAIVAGVVPGRGGQEVDGVPVFDTVVEAVEATGAAVSVAFLPPLSAADGLLEAAEAGIRLVVSTTEGVPVHRLLPVLERANSTGTRILGPNTPGLILPERLSLGFLPSGIATPGDVALISRSGTLSYEVAQALREAGLGESVWIGIGGDRIKGTTFTDLMPMIESDFRTKAIALVGEIGGSDEEDVADTIAASHLPCAALIAGRRAPPDVTMGHAGAFVGARGGSYTAKARALEVAGIQVCHSPRELAGQLARWLT